MTNQLTEIPKLQVIHGVVYASSLDIAEKFGVKHHNVLRAIENCIGELKSESATQDFAASEFIETTYRDAGNHPRKMYLLTEEGFAMSAFLFKTPQARFWQTRYIMQFKAMRITLLEKLLEKEIDKIRWRYAENVFLPFGVDILRDALPTDYAAEYLRFKGWDRNMTTAKLNGLVKDEKIEGKFIPRKSVVYADSLVRYLNSFGIFPNANELGGNGNVTY